MASPALMQAARLYCAKDSLSRQSRRCKANAASQHAALQRLYSSPLCRGISQAGPAIQPTPPISITAAGIWADAEKTLMLSPQRLMIDNSRPVLGEASFM